MNNARAYECAICGERRSGAQPWFLIADNRWQDKLRILHWHERLAAQPGICHACSADHVQELVVHWMTTGSLDYPFAQVRKGRRQSRRTGVVPECATNCELEKLGAQPIGELSVHRESMQRILGEHPHSLTAILEALLSAVRHSSPGCKPEAETRDELFAAQEV